MYSVYGIEYNHKIIYVGYRRYDSKEELLNKSYIDYTIELIYKNDGTYWEDIKNNKELTTNNIIIFKNTSDIEDARSTGSRLSYIILPKYNEIRADGDSIFYVFPGDERDEYTGTPVKEDVAAPEKVTPLTPEEELLLLTS